MHTDETDLYRLTSRFLAAGHRLGNQIRIIRFNLC
jgi:hypothetical protein